MILDETTTIAIIPDFEVGQNVFLAAHDDSEVVPKILAKIKEKDMAP